MNKIKSLYSLFYAFIYQLYRRKQSEASSQDYAVGITCILLLQHIGVIYSLIKGIFDIPSFTSGLTYGQRKLIGIPIVALILIPLFRLMKKRHKIIMEPYSNKNLLTATNSVIAIALIILPIVLIVIVQRYCGII